MIMTDYTDSTPYDPTVLHSVTDSAQAIRTKIYGKDTREAMAQMGEKLVAEMTDTGYNGAETRDARGIFNTLGARENYQDQLISEKANENDVLSLEQNLNNRMDGFTSLKDGSTTGDAELADARIGWNGTSYSNTGGAIRGQIQEMRALIDSNAIDRELKVSK